MKSAHHTGATPILNRVSQANPGGRILHVLHSVEALQETHDDIRRLHQGKLLCEIGKSVPLSESIPFTKKEPDMRIERTSK